MKLTLKCRVAYFDHTPYLSLIELQSDRYEKKISAVSTAVGVGCFRCSSRTPRACPAAVIHTLDLDVFAVPKRYCWYEA